MIITIIISITILLIVTIICCTHYKLNNYKAIANEVNDIKWELKTIKDDIEFYNTLLDRLQGHTLESKCILNEIQAKIKSK